MHKKLKFLKDSFRKSRGNYSRWLLISCEKCKAELTFYQKDGPGILKRLYFDRITAPSFPTNKKLICKKCGTLIGVSIIYDKEKRRAYRLFAGAVEKKIIKENKISRVV